MDNRFKQGDIVQHFKREMLSAAERSTRKYMYGIVGEAIHTETREVVMVYRPLYGDGGLYVRPLEMFLSEVDHDKYPDIRQKYRFEKVRTIPLQLIYEAVEMASFEGVQYLDVERQEIVSIPEDYSIYDERELEELEDKIDAGYGTRFFRLPEQHDIHDYRIMEDFICSLESDDMRADLGNLTHGRGAFRRFRDGIIRYGIEQEWYAFRDEAYMQIARDWCEDNGISYTE